MHRQLRAKIKKILNTGEDNERDDGKARSTLASGERNHSHSRKSPWMVEAWRLASSYVLGGFSRSSTLSKYCNVSLDVQTKLEDIV